MVRYYGFYSNKSRGLRKKAGSDGQVPALIEDCQLVKKILDHLNLWNVKRKPPPRANSPPTGSFMIYDKNSSPGLDDYIIDADYPIDLSRRS